MIFTDVDGNVFNYTVAEIITLQPGAVKEMTTGDWDLTLFTCTIGGATRVTVRCVAESDTPRHKRQNELREYVSRSFCIFHSPVN